MKIKLLPLLILLLIASFSKAQDQLYKGPYKWEYNYIYYAGEATYHYTTDANSERIYNGDFSFKGNIDRYVSAEDERFTFVTGSEYFGDEQQTFTMCQPKLITINGSFENGKRIGTTNLGSAWKIKACKAKSPALTNIAALQGRNSRKRMRNTPESKDEIVNTPNK